jgi:sulfhydrogenase subunit beta (sulfur reductase)
VTGIIDSEGLDTLIRRLAAEGWQPLAQTVREGDLSIQSVDGVADLPVGLHTDHAPGSSRLTSTDDGTFFTFTPGQASWRAHFSPPREPVWSAVREGDRWVFTPDRPEPAPTALIGARACEIAALAVADATAAAAGDVRTEVRRAETFVVGVQCTTPGGTCFCTSMGTGPAIADGADIVLTELRPGELLAEARTELGTTLLGGIPRRDADTTAVTEAAAAVERAADSMGRAMPEGVADALRHAADHPVWDDIAERCLGCANCTLVCPTCFCTSAVDSSSLDGTTASRDRVWASCFEIDFSAMAGHTVRTTLASRYRQWMTHKLSTWWDQFGTSGCVGCGRCITWCPVGIDITAEAARLQDLEEPVPPGEPGPIDHPFLAAIDRALPGGKDRVLVSAHTRTWAPGARIFRAGEPADRLWLLLEGRVALETRPGDRAAESVETLHGGDVLGLSWRHPDADYRFDARAVGEVVAIEVASSVVDDLARSDPAVAIAVADALLDAAEDRLQTARLRILHAHGGTPV